MKKIFCIAIVIAAIALLGWQVYEKAFVSRKPFAHQHHNVAIAVEITPIRKATIREIGHFTGTLIPLAEFLAAPKIAGRLEKLLVDIGDPVKGGQLVAVIDNQEYQQQVYQAMAELEVAQANLQECRNTRENVRREYERTVALRKKKIASESQLDTAKFEHDIQQAKLKVAAAQVSQKKASLAMAKVRLSYTKIGMPKNSTGGHWVVGERYVDEGAMLAPNTPLVSILDIGTLIAVIHVIERDYPKIQPALEAYITTDAFPGQTFSGEVVRIAPLLKEKSREARVEIRISNQKLLLKPGMFVRVQIEFDRHADATVVPLAALVKRKGTQGVFAVEQQEKRARFVPVELGIVNQTQAEILNPQLSAPVVTLGQHLLDDGARIILPQQTPTDAPAPNAAEPGLKRIKVRAAGATS